MLMDFRLLKSLRGTSGWSSSRETMVGTAFQRLTLWRSIRSSTSPGSYLPRDRTSVSPTITARSRVCIEPT